MKFDIHAIPFSVYKVKLYPIKVVYNCKNKDVYFCKIKQYSMDLELVFAKYKEQTIQGRYITLDHIEPILHRLNTNNQLQIIGKSVQGKSIYSYQIGSGPIKILLWSQMHGDESSTTKASFDCFNFFEGNSNEAELFLKKITLLWIPMLNPDGAKLYTRENANSIDLNRDSQDLSQPESLVLRSVFNSFKPDFCFNLHDQRTIYSVGQTNKPATLSFLAPAYNQEREINSSRLKAINLIVGINEVLQKYIPGQIGRFDDSFNFNCVGDTFQFFGVPTVLFEGGHYQNDYDREMTRKFLFFSMITAFRLIYENDIVDNRIDKYLNISQNNPVFCDLLYKNIKINYDGKEKIINFASQYKEEIIDGKIVFNAYIVQIDALDCLFGHYEYDAKGALYSDEYGNLPRLDQPANFFLGNFQFENGLIKS